MKPIDTKNRENIAIGDDVSQGERKGKENVIDSVNAVQKQKKKKKKSKQDITTGQMTIGHLTQGDDVMTKRIVDLAKSEDDPLILFDWDADSLTQFWNNAVAYAAGGGVVAIPINGGVNLPAAVDINLLRTEILTFVAGNPVHLPGPTIIGNTMGLACSLKQFGICMGLLTGLELHPWFAAVLNVNPIPAPLASIWCTRPRNSSGICDQIAVLSTLWA
jgi:hypothetical protein